MDTPRRSLRLRNNTPKENDKTPRKKEEPSPDQESVNSASKRREKKSSMIQYEPRQSRLEFQKLHTDGQELRGFFTLFWCFMAVYFIGTAIVSWRRRGDFVSMFQTSEITVNVDGVGVVYLLMNLGSYFALFNHRLVHFGWISRRFSFVLRHLSQFCLVAGVSWFTFHQKEWHWYQRAFIFAQSMILYMKMHSFASNNDSLLEDYLVGEVEPGYPENLTVWNYTVFLLCPSCVYQVNYPKTKEIRLSFIVEKIVGAIGLITLIHITVDHYVNPVLELIPDLWLIEVVLRLLMPFTVLLILLFFLLFDCVCNFCAEITKFADRNFYDDWWNSTSYEEFARKWNKPVHHFLLRHVYTESMTHFQLTKKSANLLTFFFSSLLHELAMIIVSRRFRFFLFIMQMIQIPLIWFGRSKFIRTRPVFGNVFFWLSLCLGTPLLAVLYCREFYIRLNRM